MVDTVTDAKDEVVLLLADLCVDHTVAPLLVDDSRKLTGVGREDMDDPEAKYESVSTSSVSLANSECRDVEPNEVISSSEGKKSKASKSKTRTFTCFQLSRYPGRTLQKQSFFSVAGLFYVFFFLEFANVQSRMRRELLRGDGDRDTDVDENEALSAFAEVEEEQNQDRRFFDIFVNQDQRFIGNVTSFLQVDTSTLGAEAGGAASMGDAPPAKKYTYDAATFVSGHFFAEYVHTTFCVEKDGASTWRKTEFPLETLCTSTAKEGDSAETGAPKAPLKEPLQKMLATKITDEEIRQGLEEFANKYGIAMQKVTELKEALDEVLDKKWKGKQNAANEPRPVYVLVHIATKPGDPTSPAHYTNFVEAFKQNKKTSEERREADGVQQYWRCFFKSTSTAADKEGSRNFVDVDQMFVTEAFQSEGADLFHRTPGLDGSFKKIWLPVRTAALAEENPQNDWPTQIYGAVQAVKDRSHIRHWMSLGTESGTASLDVNLPKGRKSGGHFTLWDDLRTRWYDCTSNHLLADVDTPVRLHKKTAAEASELAETIPPP